MRNFLKFAFVGAFLMMFQIIESSAQTNLTQAVDFTVTDTEGHTWNLFDELADGKYVLVDFFFTT